MLKHPDLTRRRIEQFISHQLKPLLYGESAPLSVEVRLCGPNEQDIDQQAAEAGEWIPVKAGYEYGPAYTTFWFRLRGDVPAHWEGQDAVVFPEIGSERTLWKDNTPIRGVDHEHTDFGMLTGGGIPLSGPVSGGVPVEFVLQTCTGNPQTRVHLAEPPREALVAKVEPCSIKIVFPAVKSLLFDFEFALQLLSSLKDSEPSFHHLLRGLNESINLFVKLGIGVAQPDGEELAPMEASLVGIDRVAKMLRDALGGLGGGLRHTIYPVGHAHLDTAWLWPISITKKKMAHTTSTQLALMEKYPDYVFVHSQACQYEWLENEYPVLFERVKAAIQRGQWEPVGSMWVEADCNLSGGESLVRQFLYGRRYFQQKLGYTTHDMWLPDVFGYSAALPQILKKFNIDFFLTQKISWNQFNKFPHNTFWWQGIDGTKVWSHFPPADTYNASAEPKEVVFSVNNYKDHARSDASVYVFGFGDGGGGPTERHIEFLRRGRTAPNFPQVAFGKRAIDFFREAKARSKDLATWVGELYLELHRGTYTSQAATKRGNRFSEFLLRDAELLATMVPSFPKNYPSALIERAWKLVLLNQFHDIIPGSSVREVYEDAAKDYATVKTLAEEIVSSALIEIAQPMVTRSMQRPIAVFHNAPIASQCELAWPESDVPQSLCVGAKRFPVQLVEAMGERKLIFETPIVELDGGPVAVGDLSELAPSFRRRIKASARRIENDQWTVRFDLNGNITSIESTEDGTEFVELGRLANVFQLLDDKPLFWSAWDIDLFAHETTVDLLKAESVELVERGPVRTAIEIVRRFGHSTIRQRVSLGPTPGIRFDTEIEWHESDKMLKVAFPINVNSPKATYEIQFGNVERPTHMNTSWDMARFEVCAQKWADLSEGEQGAAIINTGKYGYDIQGNVMRLSLLRSPKAPDPTCDMGTHRFSYVFLPHFGGLIYSEVVPAAYAVNAEPRVIQLTPVSTEGIPSLAHNGESVSVSVSDRKVVIEAVKKAEDSEARIVRLYESHNTRGEAELAVTMAVKRAVLCDMEETELSELEFAPYTTESGQIGTRILFEFKPFEIITIKLEG